MSVGPSARAPRPEPPLLAVPDRAALRKWLETNHATSSGVRLAIGKSGGTATRLSLTEAVEEGLCFGWIDSTARRLDADRYTVAFTPRRPTSTWAASNKERVQHLIAQGLMTPAGLAAVEAAKANGSWTRLDDADALIAPPDLVEALARDPDASMNWDATADSQRKMAIFWVDSAKRAETRAKRVSEIVRGLRRGRRLF